MDPRQSDVKINNFLGMVLQIGVLYGLSTAAFNMFPAPNNMVGAIFLPLIAAGIWMIFLTPGAKRELDKTWRVVGKAAICIIASLLLWFANQQTFSTALATLAMIHLVIATMWDTV
ncbi:MAG: DUF2568 domain-containing protein [Micrococcaceae bacterium]